MIPGTSWVATIVLSLWDKTIPTQRRPEKINVELDSAKMHWRARLSSGEAKTGKRPAKGKR
jgi:hypothetical protein